MCLGQCRVHLQASCWAVDLQHYMTEGLLGEILAPQTSSAPSEPGFQPHFFTGLEKAVAVTFWSSQHAGRPLPSAAAQPGLSGASPPVESLERQLQLSSFTDIYFSLSHL